MDIERIELTLDIIAGSLTRIANSLEQIEEAVRLRPAYIPLTFDKAMPVADGDELKVD